MHQTVHRLAPAGPGTQLAFAVLPLLFFSFAVAGSAAVLGARASGKIQTHKHYTPAGEMKNTFKAC